MVLRHAIVRVHRSRLLEAGVDVRFADLPAIEGLTGPLLQHIGNNKAACFINIDVINLRLKFRTNPRQSGLFALN
jgi:hypothetical protein